MTLITCVENCIDWNFISTQKLSKEFMTKYRDKLNWNHVVVYNDIEEIFGNWNNNCVVEKKPEIKVSKNVDNWIFNFRELAIELGLKIPRHETLLAYKKLFKKSCVLVIKMKNKLQHIKVENKKDLKQAIYELKSHQRPFKHEIKNSRYRYCLVSIW